MEDIKIGVIGLGDMGFCHAQCFYNMKGCTLTAICDMSDKAINRTLNELGNDKGIAVYKDYRDLICDQNVDAVVISVPNYLHKQMAIEAMDAKKDIFLEKPIAISFQEYQEILNARERNNRILQVGLTYRYSNLYRKMAEIADNGKLGNVMFMWCQELRECFPQMDWFYDQKKCGGTIVEKNTHHFDIFNWIIKSRPKRVFAMGGQHIYKNGTDCLIDCSYCPDEPKIINNIDTVDHAIVSIEYQNGAKANLNLCMYLKPCNLLNNGLEIGAIGDNGVQMVANKDELLTVAGGKDETKIDIDVDSKTDRFNNIGHIGSFRERTEFIECIKTRTNPFASLEETIDSLLIALAAEKSIQENRIIEIDELTNII